MRALDLETELNALGIPFNLIGYETKAPAYPYGIYVDDISVTGGDNASPRRVARHEITIELYHRSLPALKTACETLEAWIESVPLDYRRQFLYITEEDHYLANYTMNYTTKKG